MIPDLDRGKEGLEELHDVLERTGAVMTNETAGAFAAVNEHLNEMRLAWQGLSNRIFSAVAPAVDFAITKITSLTEHLTSADINAGLVAITGAAIGLATQIMEFCLKVEGAWRSMLAVIEFGPASAEAKISQSISNFANEQGTAHLLNHLTGTRIEDLRIHHSLVTCVPTIGQGRLDLGYTPQHLHKAEKFSEIEFQAAAFNPLCNYRLTSLTLTDIPLKSTGPTINRLITFLRLCARQEAILRAASTSGPRKTRHSPRLLPGLRRLRLEFIQERSGMDDIGPSVSGDQDADEFQAQSQGDFSFFADEKMPSSPMSRRSSVWGGGGSAKSSLAELVETKDVCEELKIFRRGENEGGKWSGKLELVVPRQR